jgi:hypothetical protein
VSFPEGRNLKKGKRLKVIVETARAIADVGFCFSGRGVKNFCSVVKVRRKWVTRNSPVKKRRVPLIAPKVYYNEIGGGMQ